MRRCAIVSCLIITVLGVMAVSAAEPTPGREFEATAKVNTRQGSRTMTLTLLASRYSSLEEAGHLAALLATGGQGAVLSSLKGRNDGLLRLGALEFPISLAIAEPVGKGYRYIFVTARKIRVEEVNEGADSLDYPFGVAVFELGDFGRGEGEIYPAAALRIDEDGNVEVEQYEIHPGRLTDVKRIR
jgi:hypothetical protein